MKNRRLQKHLLSSASRAILGTLAFLSIQTQAHASSICAADTSLTPPNFSCFDDTVSPVATATGTFSDGAVFATDSTGRLEISSTGSLDVVLNGQINSTHFSDLSSTSAVYLTASGALNYVNNGTTAGSSSAQMTNTYLSSNVSVTAHSGTVTAEGYGATGVFSETHGGDNTLIGGTTTVSGTWSRGLWSDAYGGQNITDTGTVTASGYLSRGVIARALPLGDCAAGSGGSTTVNVTGNVTADFVGITTLTCGDSTVNVEAGKTVLITGTEGEAIRNIGLLSANTNIDGSVLAASTAGRALDTRDGPSATVIGSTGYMSGTFDGDTNVDTITVASGGEWTSSGTSDFGAENDSVINNGLIRADAGIFTNLEAFTNNGTLSVTGGTFTVTGSADFTNHGTIQVSPGNTTLSIDSVLLNDGTIDMQNGQAGDILTIANDYEASGAAALWIDASDTASDTLVVNGIMTGTTQVFINSPAMINTNSILIATSEPPQGNRSFAPSVSPLKMNFIVGNQASRLIDYQLQQVGGNLYLTALPNSLAFQPLVVGEVGQDLWYQSAGIYSAYSALSRSSQASAHRRPVNLWGQVYASHDSNGDTSTQTVFGTSAAIDDRVRTDRTGVQAGLDFLLRGGPVIGLTGGYENADAHSRGSSGGLKAHGFNVGAYAQFGGDAGLHGGVLVKYDRNNAKLTNDAFDQRTGDPDFHSVGGEAQLGYRWNVGSLLFDLGSSLAYVDTSIDGFSAEGITYKFDKAQSVRGGVDAKVVFRGSKIEPFVGARLLHEFDGNNRLELQSGAEADKVETDGRKTWVRFEAGIAGREGSGPLLAGWAEVGDTKGVGIRAGWRF